MKILIVNQHVDDVLGGSEIQCDIVAKYLHKFGHDVTYYAVDGQQEKYSGDYEVVAEKLTDRNLVNALENNQPDVVYWRFDKKKLLKSVLAFKKRDIKVVFAVSSKENVEKWSSYSKKDLSDIRSALNTAILSFTRPISRRINHIGLRYVDGVTILNSQYFGEISTKPQVVIPDSMEAEVKPFEWERDFILWVANLKPNKNPEKYIQLADSIDDNIDFLMVGHIQSERYSRLLDSGETPSNFHYIGPKTPEEVNGMIQECLFLVHTCDPEGFGDIFIQSWMLKKPTVSLYFDPDGFIQDHDLGYVSYDFDTFVKDTRKLIDNPSLRRRKGIKAEKLASKKFDPMRNVKELEKFLSKVIDS